MVIIIFYKLYVGVITGGSEEVFTSIVEEKMFIEKKLYIYIYIFSKFSYYIYIFFRKTRLPNIEYHSYFMHENLSLPPIITTDKQVLRPNFLLIRNTDLQPNPLILIYNAF